MLHAPRLPFPVLSIAAALPALAVAQGTVVSPAAYASAEGPGANAFPFGSVAVPFRYLNVHDDLVGQAMLVRGLALRRSGTTSTSVTPATGVVVDGFLSTAVTTGATVDATFDANHGADRAQVLVMRAVSFPPAPTGLLPYPFLYQVVFDVPFPFAGQGPLCWEVQVVARTAPTTTFHDYAGGSSTNPSMVVSRFGQGCTASGQGSPFELTGSSQVSWSSGTGEVNATASLGPAGAPAAYLFGATALSIPLPGTQGGSSGTCLLHNDVVLTLPGALSSSGGARFALPVPLYPRLGGLDVFGQVVAVDAAANALGLVTSNGVDHQVVRPYGAQPGGRVYRSGSLAATGSVGRGQTLVVEFAR